MFPETNTHWFADTQQVIVEVRKKRSKGEDCGGDLNAKEERRKKKIHK